MGAWSYEGDTGPGHWAGLDPAFSPCGEGREQSPVDLVPAEMHTAELSPPVFRYRTSPWRLERSAQNFRVTFDEPGELEVDGRTFALAEVHFHAPSEHAVDGHLSPMTCHLVHARGDELVVVGVLIEEGAENPAYAAIRRHLPAGEGAVEVDGEPLDATAFLPPGRSSYRYSGSLTTPPCTEGVRWIVMQERIAFSRRQIDSFARDVGPNNRPLQPLAGRTVVRDAG